MQPTYDSPEWQSERDAMLAAHVGDAGAINFLTTLFTIAETWDDLIDGDKLVPVEDVNRAFMFALVGLPANPFFAKYRDQLLPLLIVGINTWQDSNKLQGGTLSERAVAYVLRDWHCEIASFCVFLLHGTAAMQRFSSVFREFHTRHETFDQYLGGQP